MKGRKINMRKNKKYAAMLAGTLAAAAVLTGCGGGGCQKSGEIPELTEDRYTLDENTPAWQLDKRRIPS